MDYEEKYNVALSRATFYNNELLTENQRKMLLDIFPELTMSEDEKIRKAIIAYIDHGQHNGISNKDMVEWLEKQGKALNPDKVIEWMRVKAPKWLYDTVYPIRLDADSEDLIEQFKKDFKLC